jgi:hypothetical protein
MGRTDESKTTLIRNLPHWTNIKVSSPSPLKEKIRKSLAKRGFQLLLDNDSRYITALNKVLIDAYKVEAEENFFNPIVRASCMAISTATLNCHLIEMQDLSPKDATANIQGIETISLEPAMKVLSQLKLYG